MGRWTFQKGIATFDTRTGMEGRQAESPLLPPEIRTPRRDSRAFLPFTKANATPQTNYSDSFSESTYPGK